jgi:tripartite-type tricarboxylate transporter receptor subunit TctC
LPRIAKAQAYPSRPVRIVVGFPPGGPPDIAARVLAGRFSEAWGRPVVVENATGSGGNIAVERAARAQPDGYTLLMVSNAIVINPGLYEKLPYAQSDLAPISLAVFTPCILVVNNNVPAKSVQEIVALARAQPGKLTFGHAGVGTPAHLAGELFKVRAGLDIQAVPYRGMPVALPDLLSGIITMMFPNLQVALPLVGTGQARALAVTSLQRFSATPTSQQWSSKASRSSKRTPGSASWRPPARPRRLSRNCTGRPCVCSASPTCAASSARSASTSLPIRR